MKFLPSQFAYLLSRHESRQNLTAFAKFLLVLGGIIVVYAELFHLVMRHVENKEHSWLTGLYWTLTVMTTLGFGDITFQTDLGRFFSIVVLLTGVVLLLTVLPFTFIRYFYAPWIEAQIHLRAPRELPAETKGHVVIVEYDDIAKSLITRLDVHGTPYVVVEPDPTVAARLVTEGVKVVSGDVDNVETYRAARAESALLVVANLSDAINTNVTLTVREQCPKVPIVAIVEDHDAVDIVRLAGASLVLPLKHRLGAHLAARARGGARASVIGSFGALRVAEIAVHATELAGKTVRETDLRKRTGLHVVGYWQRGRLLPALPDAVLEDHHTAVVVGREEHLAALDTLLADDPGRTPTLAPVLVIGSGKVGRAAARALKDMGLAVHVIERDPKEADRARPIADQVTVGDAADLHDLEKAGLLDASNVILSANDDAMNIYLAVYCRKLRPDVHIVSRITHERNIESIHRAGADFVLSYTTLGVRYLMSFMQSREPVILGEGVDLDVLHVSSSLAGKTLAESGIGKETGLIVVAMRRGGEVDTEPKASTVLDAEAELIVVGSPEQRLAFKRRYGDATA